MPVVSMPLLSLLLVGGVLFHGSLADPAAILSNILTVRNNYETVLITDESPSIDEMRQVLTRYITIWNDGKHLRG